MHRFFVEPRTLSQDRSVWIDRKDDTRWRYLLDGFREKIRRHEWKAIDLHIRLSVKIEDDEDKPVLVEDLGSRSDYYLASAYLKAGLLEHTPIIVFADTTIPWESLRRFRAVNPPRRTRRKDGAAGHKGDPARGSSHESATEERHSGPSSLANETARSGDPDIVAGDCLIRPKQHEADCRGKDPDSRSSRLTGRLAPRARVTRA